LQVEPVQVLNVPVIPVGPLIATAYPLLRNPVYALSWLNAQISAQGMMDQKLFEKLVLNNFGRFQIFCFRPFASQLLFSLNVSDVAVLYKCHSCHQIHTQNNTKALFG